MSADLKLYELPNHIVMCRNMLEDGDLSPEDYTELVDTAIDTIEDEAQYYLQMISTDDHHIDVIKNEIKRLQELKRIKEDRIASKKAFIKDVMTKAELTKIETPYGKFSFRKSESVEIVDAEELDQQFTQVTIERKPLKTEIKKHMKENKIEEIPGAKLVKKNNLQVK